MRRMVAVGRCRVSTRGGPRRGSDHRRGARDQSSRAKSSFERSRPLVVKRTRPSPVGSTRPDALAQARVASHGGSRTADERARRHRVRRPRMSDSATAASRVEGRFHAAGWQRRRPTGSRSERGDVGIEPGRVPAADQAVEGVGTGPDGLVPGAAPSRPGCGGSRDPAGPSSTARSRGSRASARRCDGEVVHRRRPGRRPARRASIAPAPGAGRRRQVIAVGPGQPLGVGVVEGQRVERQVVRRRGRAPRSRLSIQLAEGLTRDVVEEVEVDRADPGRAGGRDRVGDVDRRVPPTELAELRGRGSSGPRYEIRVTPGLALSARGRRARRVPGWPRG